jgi:hypothetical protein
MRNKWASCSNNGHLNFSDDLPALKHEVPDYVIVHELLHFFVPNHGRLWKSLMRVHLGDYERIEEVLRENDDVRLRARGDRTSSPEQRRAQLDYDRLGRNHARMKARLDKLKTGELAHTLAVPNGQEEDSGCCEAAESGIDVSLLEDSLARTPWERMQANDDALRFADSLRTAMEERNARSERTDAQAH